MVVSYEVFSGKYRWTKGSVVSTVKVTLVELMLPKVSLAQRINVDCWSSNAENDVLSVKVVFALLYSYQVVSKWVSVVV